VVLELRKGRDIASITSQSVNEKKDEQQSGFLVWHHEQYMTKQKYCNKHHSQTSASRFSW